MTVYDAEELRIKRQLRVRANELGYTQAQFDTLWQAYDSILQETARQLTKVWLLRFQRTRA